MALAVTSSSAVVTSSASSNTIPRSFTAGLKPATLVSQPKMATLASKTVSNGSRVNCMLVLDPVENHHYETLSYLPPLSTEQLLKQVDYMIKKGLIPCIEFSEKGAVSRDHFKGSGYYDGRYWTMWKLPMFGCQDSAAVLREVEECKKSYPKFNIRIIGFDKVRQVQIVGFVVQKGETF